MRGGRLAAQVTGQAVPYPQHDEGELGEIGKERRLVIL